jgi:hypothetical protein
MAWSASAVFRSTVETWVATPAEALDLNTDTFKVALWDNDITPNKDDTQANNCYAAGQWVSAGNEVSDGAEWVVAGQTLSTPAVSTGAGFVMWDGVDTASGASATLASVYGCLVYDDTSTTPSDQGICYNYFGGTNSVTDGTFTVVWHANGILRITV